MADRRSDFRDRCENHKINFHIHWWVNESGLVLRFAFVLMLVVVGGGGRGGGDSVGGDSNGIVGAGSGCGNSIGSGTGRS